MAGVRCEGKLQSDYHLLYSQDTEDAHAHMSNRIQRDELLILGRQAHIQKCCLVRVGGGVQQEQHLELRLFKCDQRR